MKLVSGPGPLGISVEPDETTFPVRIFVGSVTVSGGAVASFGLSSLGIDLNDFDVEIVLVLDKAASGQAWANLILNSVAVTGFSSQTALFNTSAVTVARVNAPKISLDTTDPSLFVYNGKILLSTNNKPVILGNAIQELTSDPIAFFTNILTISPLTNNIITDIDVTMSAGSVINNGSKLVIYKREKTK